MEKPTENQTTQEMAREAIYGQVKRIILPSGYFVDIRETNGEDDDVLSNEATSRDLTNIHIFVASLIINTDLPFAVNNRITLEGARMLLLRDKYFILVSSRIHSNGNEIKIQYDWGETQGGKMNYIEDLNRYVWDYTKPFPQEEEEEGYDSQKIKPYPKEAYGKHEMILSTGKKLRFNLLDGNSESFLLKLDIEKQTRNSELKSRNLEQWVEDKWVKVDSFIYFKRNEMAELHKFFTEHDSSFTGLTEIENPKTKELLLYPIMKSTDFFYPGEI